MTKKKLVVVDADTIVFRSAAVAEQRTVEVEHLPSGRKKIYKNKTTFKKAMKEKGYSVKPEEFSFVDIQEPEPISHCLHNIKLQADGIIERFSDADVIFCAGDKNNFRLDLPLPTRYKSNRDETVRPFHLKDARDYFISKYKAVSADGYEVDDLSIILAYEGLHKGKDAVLCSPDKDAKQAIGLKLFDYVNPDKPIVEINEWHDIELDSKRDFKSYGVPWLCYQWINGDLSDGFSAKSLVGIKLGDVGFHTLFKDCKKPKDNLEVVVNWFKDSFGDSFNYNDWNGNEVNADWKEIMGLYYKCCRMKCREDDALDYNEILERYGISI